MSPRIAARLAPALLAIAIALILTACGDDGGIAVVPDEERQERQEILDSESDGDAGLGEENSREAQDETLDQELDGDASQAGGGINEPRSETFSVAGAETSVDMRTLPCSSDDGYVRTAEGDVGCVSAAELADIVSCGEDSRAVLDLANLTDEAADIPFTACVPLGDAPEDVFEEEEEEVEIDD